MSVDPVARYEAALKVTGRAVFPGEVRPDGLLHAVLVQAAIACGDVVTVDGTEARGVHGFADLVSYADTQTLRPSSVTQLIREPQIHFPGQPIALVAAETLLAARSAARAVRVDERARRAGTALD